MVEKFSEFDEYQLGKHGQKVKKEDIPIFVPENDEEDDVGEGVGRDERELAKRRFSVKRLIRLLHIKAPVYHVMAILGKKYVEYHTVWKNEKFTLTEKIFREINFVKTIITILI